MPPQRTSLNSGGISKKKLIEALSIGTVVHVNPSHTNATDDRTDLSPFDAYNPYKTFGKAIEDVSTNGFVKLYKAVYDASEDVNGYYHINKALSIHCEDGVQFSLVGGFPNAFIRCRNGRISFTGDAELIGGDSGENHPFVVADDGAEVYFEMKKWTSQSGQMFKALNGKLVINSKEGGQSSQTGTTSDRACYCVEHADAVLEDNSGMTFTSTTTHGILAYAKEGKVVLRGKYEARLASSGGVCFDYGNSTDGIIELDGGHVDFPKSGFSLPTGEDNELNLSNAFLGVPFINMSRGFINMRRSRIYSEDTSFGYSNITCLGSESKVIRIDEASSLEVENTTGSNIKLTSTATVTSVWVFDTRLIPGSSSNGAIVSEVPTTVNMRCNGCFSTSETRVLFGNWNNEVSNAINYPDFNTQPSLPELANDWTWVSDDVLVSPAFLGISVPQLFTLASGSDALPTGYKLDIYNIKAYVSKITGASPTQAPEISFGDVSNNEKLILRYTPKIEDFDTVGKADNQSQFLSSDLLDDFVMRVYTAGITAGSEYEFRLRIKANLVKVG